MINQTAVMMGAFRYEFMMQIRRRSLWITFFLIACLLIILTTRVANPRAGDTFTKFLAQLSLTYNVAYWIYTFNRLFPLGVGCLLADRLVRDFRTKSDELFVTTPSALSSRLLGKYIGTLLATLVPFLIVDIGYTVVITGNILTIPIALETFAVMVLP